MKNGTPVIRDKKENLHFEGIKGIKTDVTTTDLLEVIREGREGRDYFREKY
jgi:hypothetical protein